MRYSKCRNLALEFKEFKKVFPIDFFGMPPDWDIDFCIYLEPGTGPISIPPYCMALVELGEIKAQIQEVLDKVFIPLTPSLWGAPIFVEKKDNSMRMCISTVE